MTGSGHREPAIHAITVGATGMLAGATVALAGRCRALTIVARRASDFADATAFPSSLRLNCIDVDYRRSEALRELLASAVAALGPAELVLAWIHSDAPRAPRIVAETVVGNASRCVFVHVKGTSGPPWPERRRLHSVLDPPIPGLSYKEVILGGVRSSTNWRWLTHREISAGALAAIETPEALTIVGEVP